MKRRSFCLGSAALASLSLGLPRLGAAQQKLTLGHALSTTSHYSAGARGFADKLGELSDGKYAIHEAYGGSLGGEREMIESTQLGTIDLVITASAPVGNFVPDTEILDIPFLFSGYEQARGALDGPLGQALLDKFPEHGLQALAWAENGFRNITNNVRPIHGPDDVKGLKIRTMENDIHLEAFRTLGMLPTPMNFNELFTALEQGTVDGQENPLGVILSAKFSEVQKYLSLSRHVYSPALVLISPSLWGGLSDQEQEWFMEAAKAGVQACRDKVEEDDNAGVGLLREQGMDIVEEVDTAAFQDKLAPAFAKFAQQFGQDNIDALQNYGA